MERLRDLLDVLERVKMNLGECRRMCRLSGMERLGTLGDSGDSTVRRAAGRGNFRYQDVILGPAGIRVGQPVSKMISGIQNARNDCRVSGMIQVVEERF